MKKTKIVKETVEYDACDYCGEELPSVPRVSSHAGWPVKCIEDYKIHDDCVNAIILKSIKKK